MHATYFPLEGKWVVSTLLESGQPWREVTGFHPTLIAAANAALGEPERLGERRVYLTTASGRAIDVQRITPEDICIYDIAHSLSQQCRFGGHTTRWAGLRLPV